MSLYIVGTPIGNLEDITLRAIKTLNQVSVIACENIPRTKILLSHLGILNKKLIEYSPANEKNSAQGIINLLEQGQDVALVSDAGTPCVSDPGVLVVKFAGELGFPVIPIPGVSALTTILSVAGIGGDNVVFTGFLSKKEGQLIKTLQHFADKNNVLVIFLSCRRVKKFLKTLKDLSISADIMLGRELTKSYESFYRGSLEKIEIPEQECRGEFVAVIKFHQSFSLPQVEQGFSKKEKRRLKQQATDRQLAD
ncbi:MAG: 16S rRNA (cytidine(1402)-2'-O)-methyltransferase [Brevinema sp.]